VKFMTKLIGQRYSIVEELGAGGMGTVYKGIDTHSEVPVAIKKLKAEMQEKDLFERFEREGEALRALDHPNIVKMLDAVKDASEHYLIMEYVSGGDLRQQLQKVGKLNYRDCIEIAIDLADALTRAHRLNIIHRDLKPANVLIAPDGTVRLSDFGIAHFVNKQRVTDKSAIVGTIDYLAPEIFSGQTVSNRADIWSFGVMLFEMLSGKHPFASDSLVATITAVLTAPVPNLESLVPDLPTAMVDLIYRMLERDPLARIASVRHVGAALADILEADTQRLSIHRFDASTPEYFYKVLHNLPAQATAFVGREREILDLAKLMENPEIRLLSIIAPGGMGKTRLSLELAQHQIEHFVNGVYFVELAPVTTADAILTAIADALGYQFQADERDEEQQLLELLSNKQMLLLMDNFEHLLDGAPLVSRILKAAPQIRILVTSRQRLNQSAETVYKLGGMDFSQWETAADALETAAVKLFLQSAKRVQPQFEINASNLNDVALICKLVQGMPLGLLLAASWLGMLSVEEIAAEIARGIDFLESNLSDFPERHRSIRAIFDYSWSLMTAEEQAVFMKFAVFRGGFTREAAQAVAGASLQTLMKLLNKSMLRRDVNTGRYEIHELLRQYAEEKLALNEAVGLSRDAHARYFLELVESAAPNLRLAKQEYWYTQLEAERENVAFALNWTLEQKLAELHTRMVVALRDFWYYQGYHTEAINWYQRSISLIDNLDNTLKGKFYMCFGTLEWVIGDMAKAHEFYELAVKLQRSGSDKQALAWAITYLAGETGLQDNQLEYTLALCDEALALSHEINDRACTAFLYNIIGNAYEHVRDYPPAIKAFEKSMEIARQNGEMRRVGIMLHNLAVMAFETDQYARAYQLLWEGARLGIQLKASYMLTTSLVHFGRVLTKYARFEEAVFVLTVYSHHSEATGYRVQPMDNQRLADLQALLKTKLEPAQYQAARERGLNASLYDALQFMGDCNLEE
jgi:predicted ATPase